MCLGATEIVRTEHSLPTDTEFAGTNKTYFSDFDPGAVNILNQILDQTGAEIVVSSDWKLKTKQAHEEIWKFHNELKSNGIKHVFFNGNNDFSQITDRHDWGSRYIGPYDPNQTYDSILRVSGIETVAPNSWHFGKDGHSYFHRFMLQYIIANKFI